MGRYTCPSFSSHSPVALWLALLPQASLHPRAPGYRAQTPPKVKSSSSPQCLYRPGVSPGFQKLSAPSRMTPFTLG